MIDGFHAPRVWEPFCGGCWVTQHVRTRPLHASDANKYVIALWDAVSRGWLPPEQVSEEEYQQVRAAPDENPALTGFVGAGCSFGGKWWGGYAGRGTRNYAANAARSCAKKAPGLYGVSFVHSSYTEIRPAPGDLVYCDPPYERTSYGYVKGFDAAEFWAWAEQLARAGAIVLVSELKCPVPHVVLREFDVLRGSKNKEARRDVVKECLFRLVP